MRPPLLVAALLLAPVCAAPAAEHVASMRIRLEWGGGRPRAWSGLVEIEGGRFENLVPLGVDADLPGTTWIDGSAVWIQRGSRRVYDGLDVTAVAPPDARLRITLQSNDEPPLRRSVAIALRELVNRPLGIPVGEGGDRVSLRRAPGDALGVAINRDHVVFHPGESFDPVVSLNAWHDDVNAVDGRLRWSLVPARSEAEVPTIAEGSRRVVIAPLTEPPTRVPMHVELPDDDGVYDLRLELSAAGRSIRRSVQVVVVSREPPRAEKPDVAENERDDRLVDTIDAPEKARTRTLHRRGRLGFVRSGLDGLQRILGPAERPEDVGDGREWVAFRLHGGAVGRLHRLVVTFDANVPRGVGVSVLQPNAVGQLAPIGVDGGVEIREGDGEEVEGGREVPYELIFRTRTTEPVVLLHTAANDLGLRRIELFESATGEPKPLRRPPEAAVPRRLVGPFLRRPLLAESFGVGEARDSETDRSLDDWVSFDTAARDLASAIVREGGNAVMIEALADGSGLLPCPELQPTLRFDTGQHFSTGQDPVRKDVLQLLLRTFEREGLAVVPLLEFTSALRGARPGPGRSTSNNGTTSNDKVDGALPLVHVTGRSIEEFPSGTDGVAPHDPLDPRVQSVLVGVVRRFAERYRNEQAMAAIAIDVGRGTLTSYPGPEWGYADEIVSRFARETGTELPKASTDEARRSRNAMLLGKYREKWLGWREREVHAFHRRLAAAVVETVPRLECVLLTDDDGAVRTRRPMPSSEAESTWPPRTRVLRRTTLSVADLGHRDVSPADVFEFAPEHVRIPEFDDESPWQPAFTWLETRRSATGPRARQPLAAALAKDARMVFTDDWLATGDVDRRELRKRIRELPRTDFVTVPNTPQPVVVRTARVGSRTWLYVVNAFPHPVDVHLRLRGSKSDERISAETTESGDPPIEVDGAATVPLSLRPFDVHVMAIDSARLTVEGVDVRVPAAITAALDRRLDHLDELIGRLRSSGRTRVADVSNPGFEVRPAAGEAPPGWKVEVTEATHWSLDEGDVHSGRSALRLEPEPRKVASAATTVSIGDDSRATVTAWLRAESDEARVRLVFETERDGKVHRRHAPVAVTKEWRKHTFRISDLADGPDRVARVGFEVLGPTPVWIDDLAVQLSTVTPERMRELEKTYAAASLALEEERFSDAVRLLNGDWSRDANVVDAAATEPAEKSKPKKAAEKPASGERATRPGWPWRLFGRRRVEPDGA